MFSQKLDYLIKLTNTTNSGLAHSVSLDPSYISRLRSGVRTPVKDALYLEAMADFFSKHIKEDYQKKDILEKINIPEDFQLKNRAQFSRFIYLWLLEEEITDSIEGLLSDIENFSFKKNKPKIKTEKTLESNNIIYDNDGFCGIEGKRKAVIFFLSELLKQEPETILLYSDENMDWLTGDMEFTKKWRMLLLQVVLRGNKIKIIHTVDRNLDEMICAIREWLPLYMTGSIQSYYYPRTRDGVFKRTLFISSTIAISSNSIKNNKNSPTFVHRDKKIIGGLVEEYNNFLSLCRPLMKLFNSDNRYDYLDTLLEFEMEEGNSFLKVNGLSSITMPIGVAHDILLSIDKEKRDQLLIYHKKRLGNLEKNLKNHNFTQILDLPDVEDIRDKKIPVVFSDIHDANKLFYTKKLFIKHLYNYIELLNNFPNYKLYVNTNTKSPEYMIYTKEDVGAIISKTSSPPVIFAINEDHISRAFWDYGNRLGDNFKKLNIKREDTIKIIQDYIEEIKS